MESQNYETKNLFLDYELVCSDGSLYYNSYTLSKISKVFYTLLNSNFKETADKRIIFSDKIYKNELRDLLYYYDYSSLNDYKIKKDIRPEFNINLYKFCHLYDIKNYKDLLLDNLFNVTNFENLIENIETLFLCDKNILMDKLSRCGRIFRAYILEKNDLSPKIKTFCKILDELGLYDILIEYNIIYDTPNKNSIKHFKTIGEKSLMLNIFLNGNLSDEYNYLIYKFFILPNFRYGNDRQFFEHKMFLKKINKNKYLKEKNDEMMI